MITSGNVSIMAGRSHATLHLDGKELFTVKLDQPGILVQVYISSFCIVCMPSQEFQIRHTQLC